MHRPIVQNALSFVNKATPFGIIAEMGVPEETIFDKILKNEVPNWRVWEDANYLAFLSPFASTPGLTIVIPKTNPGDYLFDTNDDIYQGLLSATKTVAKLLEKAFNTRIALVFEGTGVPYVHAKLYPMHSMSSFDESKLAGCTVFFEDYPGYITTQSGPLMATDKLNEIRDTIRKYA